MDADCHLCGTAMGEAAGPEAPPGFECADCGEPTCRDCKSLGVARDTDHCRRCRG